MNLPNQPKAKSFCKKYVVKLNRFMRAARIYIFSSTYGIVDK